MHELGLRFEVIPSAAPEIEHAPLTPEEHARVNAWRKAEWVARKHPNRIVLGADTVVSLGQRLLGKPADLAEAEEFLGGLAGRTHTVVTGVCLVRWKPFRQCLFADHTDVTFRSLSRARIRRYLALVSPLDKAGGYGIQEHGEMIVSHIDGSLTNVIGFPTERFIQEWRRFLRGDHAHRAR